MTSPHPSVQLHMYLVIIETKITKSSHFQLSRYLILSDQSWQLFKICHFKKKKKKTFLFFLLLPERKHAHELWEDDLIYRFIEKIKLIRFDISLRIPSGLCSCYILVNPNLNFFSQAYASLLALILCTPLTCSSTERLNNLPVFT